jgi:hypothetical protein
MRMSAFAGGLGCLTFLLIAGVTHDALAATNNLTEYVRAADARFAVEPSGDGGSRRCDQSLSGALQLLRASPPYRTVKLRSSAIHVTVGKWRVACKLCCA